MRGFFGKNQVLHEFAEAKEDERGWRIYDGLEEALDACEAHITELCGGRAPAALVCFSQGANFGSMLVSTWAVIECLQDARS